MARGIVHRAAAVTLAVLVTATNLIASAAARPDLTVAAPKATNKLAVAGGRLAVTATVGSAGAAARRTKTAFYLSRDRRRSKTDALLGRKTTLSIRKGASRPVGLYGTVPRLVAPGGYRVLACADAASAVRESRERNNCKASRSKVTISRPFDATPFGPVQAIDVQLAVDPGSSVQRLVSALDGGRLELELPDGTTFTLDVPPGALLEDVELKMTALTNIANDPFGGGFVAGVKLQPEGISFFEPVLLTISPGDDIAPNMETPVSGKGNGNDFQLHPVLVQAGDPVLPLSHFSFAGLFEATPQERAAQLQRRASDHASALEQQMHDAISAAREIAKAGGDPGTEWMERAESIFDRYYGLVVRPLLIAALNDHTLLAYALQKSSFWQRQAGLISLSLPTPSQREEIRDLVAKAIRNYIDKVIDRCINKHDLGVLVEILRIQKTLEILFMPEVFPDDAIAKVERCMSFELEFDSTLERTSNYPEVPGTSGGETFRVRSIIPFNLSELPTTRPLEQFGPYEGLWFNSGGGCEFSANYIRAGQLRLIAVFLNNHVTWVEDPRDPTRERTIVDGVGLRPIGAQGVHLNCDGFETDDHVEVFEREWGRHHLDEAVEGEGGLPAAYLVGPLQETTQPGVVARGVFEHFMPRIKSCSDRWGPCDWGYDSDETTIVTIRHKPQV